MNRMNRKLVIRTSTYRIIHAYLTGIGLRVIANRHLDAEWSEWIIAD